LTEHDDFVRDAIENYDKLPQETSELYKRYFINIPFDIKTWKGTDSGEGKQQILALQSELSRFNIKFDLVLGGNEIILGNESKFIKVEDAKNTNNAMHKSAEDKYVAYINSVAKNYVLIDIPKGVTANLNILMLNSDMPLNTKVIVNAGDDSKLNIFEYYGSSATNFSTLGVIHEVNIGKNSEMEINAVHNENSNTLSLVFCKNIIGTDSHLILNSVYNGAAHTRVRNVIDATEKKSKVDVNEVIFGSKTQKFDVSTFVINSGAETHASLESKAALMDTSFCIMKGYAKIKKGATKAKSYVHERGILLDKGARVNGLPDMSVDESDVKATHSSATSPVDPESVFYLMSKGIDDIGVKKLLVNGFFTTSIAKIHNTLMKELSMSLINNKLENRTYGIIPKIDARNIWVTASDVKETDMFKGHYKYRGAE
jgi:Fe-S cluster assembly protein SufD